jgi:membrane-associated protease RseP (regulator of RpoE activity)
MTLIDGLLLFFSILFAYFIIVYILHKKGILKKYNISFYGPALLLRTKKFRNFIKKLSSRKRFWELYGNFSIAFCFFIMIFMLKIFIEQVWLLYGLGPDVKEILPGPDMMLVLPGINPLLPLEYIWYIIIALAIAILVHEFSHGILTFASDLKVKSLGILYLIIPIGAFVEPDEEELSKTKASKRMRVFAVGPMANFIVAFVALLLLSFVFMSAVEPIEGTDILAVYTDTPASDIGMSKGDLIFSVDEINTPNISVFRDIMSNTSPGQKINITYMQNEKIINNNLTLISYYDFIENNRESLGITTPINESYKNISFLGISFNIYKQDFTNSLQNPFTYKFPEGFLNMYSIPFMGYLSGYNPIAKPFTYTYEINGPLAFLSHDVFWGFVNVLYWIFWLNLAVGIFNSLPIVPFDGGFIFRDAIGVSVKKIKKDISDERKELIVKRISLIVSLVVLFLVLFPFFFKYI